jgi:hypothetical protein
VTNPESATTVAAPAADAAEAGCARTAILVAAAAPATAATLLILCFVMSEMAGHTPLAYDLPRNIAEAAGMGNGSEVLRMLRDGQDPNAILPISPEIISSSITQVTAVEAAVWGRRVQLLRLLEREGAIRDAARRQYIACLATLARVPMIVEEFGSSGVGDCDEQQVTRQLEDRSQ